MNHRIFFVLWTISGSVLAFCQTPPALQLLGDVRLFDGEHVLEHRRRHINVGNSPWFTFFQNSRCAVQLELAPMDWPICSLAIRCLLISASLRQNHHMFRILTLTTLYLTGRSQGPPSLAIRVSIAYQ